MKASRSCKSVTESNNSEGAVRGMSIGCPVPSRFAVFWRGGGEVLGWAFGFYPASVVGWNQGGGLLVSGTGIIRTLSFGKSIRECE